MSLSVRAIGGVEGERKPVGYHDLKRRYPGDVFTIESEKQFSPNWMEYVDGPSPAPSEPSDVPKPAKRGQRKTEE